MKYQGTYGSQFYQLVINDYISSSLALYGILIDLVLSLERFCLVKNTKQCNKTSYQLKLLFLFLTSFAIYSPVLLMKEITIENEFTNRTTTSNMTSHTYKLVTTDLGKSPVGEFFKISIGSIRIFLSSIFLTSINILTAMDVRKRFARNLRMNKKSDNSFQSNKKRFCLF